MRSIIVIADVNHAPAVDLLVTAVNPAWEGALTKPLSPTGDPPETHLACGLHGDQCEVFAGALAGVQASPPSGYSAQDIVNLLALVSIYDRELPPAENFALACSEKGLVECP